MDRPCHSNRQLETRHAENVAHAPYAMISTTFENLVYKVRHMTQLTPNDNMSGLIETSNLS